MMVTAACSVDKEKEAQSLQEKIDGETATVKIDIFAKKACNATEPTIQLVKDTIRETGVSSELNIMLLKSHSRAIDLKVIGSPTIRVNGADIDPAASQIRKYGLT